MRVRSAALDDFLALCRLYAELNSERPPLTGARGEEQWRRLLAHPGTDVFVADAGDGPLAAVTLHVLPNMTYGGAPYALIENVVAATDRRGEGLGQAVMAHAVEQARLAGCYKVMLLTGRLRGAAGFYRKLGFNGDEKTGMILRFDKTL
ncbi:MAG: GNAT family N-acetyltransferase [Kiloniellales bacterium]|nr:GNAT family N-acetyltransferase [Kiloniellales bacterium]